MIRQLIKDLRKQQGLTLKALAEKTGLSVGYLSDIEVGRSSGTIETLQKIANGLGLTLVIRFEDNGQDVIKEHKYDVLVSKLKGLLDESLF